MITRLHTDTIREKFVGARKIVIIYGPRQVGKTTLARMLLQEIGGKHLEINGDNTDLAPTLSSRSLQKLKELVAGYDLLFIDEAQRIPDIGINLKILHDNIPTLRIIVTGSSSFDLASKIQEPLTGRTWTFTLLPIGVCELALTQNRVELKQALENHLVFGAYPESLTIANRAERAEYLRELTQSYLYKDVLDLSGIKHASKLRDLTRLLAYQIGSEVSLVELANALKIAKETVFNYIDLLEKSFVLFRLSSFSRNLRKEISRHDKVFFYDLGIRNAVIENFQPLAARDDVGKLWENYLIIERIKAQTYRREDSQRFFWRTYTGAELDYVEVSEGQIRGYEFKFGSKPVRAPRTWSETYPEAQFQLVNQENYLDFIG
jgi:uncharacterized protein